MTRFAFAAALFLTLTVSVSAAFTGTDLIVPATGRAPGAGGSQFYTTFWITNPGDSTADVIIQFLLAGQSNTAPASFNDTIAPGATKVYENVAESLFNIRNGLGAARVVGSQKLLVSARVFNQTPGTPANATQGLVFSCAVRARIVQLTYVVIQTGVCASSRWLGSSPLPSRRRRPAGPG